MENNILTDKKVNPDFIDEQMGPLELDLIAFFNLLQNDIFSLMEDYQGTPDAFINDVLSLLDDQAGGHEVRKSLDAIHLKPVYKAARKLEGRLDFQGLKISIENAKGSVRSGVDQDGHGWSIKMLYPYGYIRCTEGEDGDHLDCYIGDAKESSRVFIIHQNDPVSGSYDEDKVMLGFNTAEQAKKAYTLHYDRPGFFGFMEEMEIEDFKAMLADKWEESKSQVNKSRLYSLAANVLKSMVKNGK